MNYTTKFILLFTLLLPHTTPAATKITTDSLTLSTTQFEVTDSKTLIDKYYKGIIAFSPATDNLMTCREILENGAKKDLDYFINYGTHPFVASVYFAFAEHKNLKISPDMIWLIICQGVSVHINLNSSKYRHYFTQKLTKETLKVRFDSLRKDTNDTNWVNVIKMFSEEISKRTDSTLFCAYNPTFSTSGPIEKAAFQLTLLNSVKSYYDYYVETLCGIPEIEILGTREDWSWIYENIDRFDSLDLGWWTKELKPVIKEFLNAFDDNINKSFWCGILTSKGKSGAPLRVTGWVKKFFPYVLNEKKEYVRNEYIGVDDIYDKPFSWDGERTGESYLDYRNKWNSTGLKMAQFSTGVQETPFDWQYFTKKYKMKLYSGFIGISYDNNTGFLRPEIGYLVGKR